MTPTIVTWVNTTHNIPMASHCNNNSCCCAAACITLSLPAKWIECTAAAAASCCSPIVGEFTPREKTHVVTLAHLKRFPMCCCPGCAFSAAATCQSVCLCLVPCDASVICVHNFEKLFQHVSHFEQLQLTLVQFAATPTQI